MALPALTIFLIGQTLLLLVLTGVNSINKEYFYKHKFNNICKEYESFVPKICRNSSQNATGGGCKSITIEFTTDDPDDGIWLEAVKIAACTNEDGNVVNCASTSTDETKFLEYDYIIDNEWGGGHCSGTSAQRDMPEQVVEAIKKKRRKNNFTFGGIFSLGR